VARSPEPLSSWSVSSERLEARDSRTRLEVRADVVIYGRAAPGAEVVIDGTPVKVRGDGTFDLRFSLPVKPAPGPKESP
jgi:hypothetical protein